MKSTTTTTSITHIDDAAPLHPASFPNQPHGRFRDIPATIANVKYLLESYSIAVQYNCIKKKLLIHLPDPECGIGDNYDNSAMTSILSLATLNGMSTTAIPSIVEALADRCTFNPVTEWIRSRPWDGVDRMPDICATLTVRKEFPEPLKKVLVHKWLLSAVAAAVKETGFKARGVLVLQGPQGIGKTSWVGSLVPDAALRDMVIKVDHHLDANNKDSILGAITHWIVEIGELDSSFKKDFARLKGFLTNDSDKVRRPYARTESEYPRRTVFFATVNDENFLVDHTGNTRWWTLPVESINFEHRIDMQQVFAQLAQDLLADKQWWLTKEEEQQLETHNSLHRTNSVLRERLLDAIDLTRKDLPAMSTCPLQRSSRCWR
jgi:predicted P-loop ATPase